MHSTELKNEVIRLNILGKSKTEISTETGLPYQTIRFMLNPMYKKSNLKPGRLLKINNRVKKCVDESVKRLKEGLNV